MYLSSEFRIDPSLLTEINLVKPTKGFAKMAFYLTGGLAKEKEEQETFAAVSILQQINISLRAIGVTNIIRLSKDDEVLYEDKEGKEDDFKEAIDKVGERMAETNVDLFTTLSLILEHSDEDLVYVIEILINRTHGVGEYPIVVKLNGLANEFGVRAKKADRQTATAVKRRLKQEVFGSQEQYDVFVEKTRAKFESFVNGFQKAICDHMQVDHVDKPTDKDGRWSDVSLIRPNGRVKSLRDLPNNFYHDPVFYGLPGMETAFFYAWIWSELCHDNNINCHDCWIVDENGADVLEVGDSGFDAGVVDTLNPDAEFTVPNEGDVTTYGENEYAEQSSYTPEPSDVSTVGTNTGGESSSWFGGFFSGGGDGGSWSLCGGGNGGDGGGCGGGCGGCGGG